MLLKGFGFSGYRSIGNELAKISPLKKVNFIIGKNNSGKSNIVNFIKEQYPYFFSRIKTRNVTHSHKNTFQETDKHLSNEVVAHRIAFALDKNEFENHIDSLPNRDNHNRHKNYISKLFDSIQDKDGFFWFIYKAVDINGPFELEIYVDDLIDIFAIQQWRDLLVLLTGSNGNDIRNQCIPQIFEHIAFRPPLLNNVEVIPAIRQIGKAGSQSTDYSGDGIIERLAKLQNPELKEQWQKENFIKINKFLKEVLNNQSAEIEIPHNRNMVLVHMDGKTLPLESLGTGVHEVIILAAASTLLDETVICVEEPELHLHPLLQRKLISYLSEYTNNQYFFTTHSAHLLDAVEAEVLHVTYQDGHSIVTSISSTEERSEICKDLGYKASDILQSNCVIWVEGPSDRIYLNYWIKAKNSRLEEGLHYSIMFYGGRLASHLSGLDIDDYKDEFENFISLRQLNRNSVIVIDSDRSAKGKRINKTKTRLKSEFEQGNGFAWITQGREIENYLIDDKVEGAVIEIHPTAEKLIAKGDWSNLLEYRKKNSRKKVTANKVKVAKYYTENNIADFTILDISVQITKLCTFIEEVN